MYELTPDTEIYIDQQGNEVIVTDDLQFYIDNLSYDSVKLSENLATTPSVIRSLTQQLKDSSNKIANRYYRYLTNNNTDYAPEHIMQLNDEYHNINELNYTQLSPTHSIIKQGREKHSAFLKSLDIVAARIPAQSQQSYMPMKVVAYDNPDINTAYVSTYQILLQGSDYDIDSVSLATYDVNANGTISIWSPYANTDSIDLLNASMKIPFPTGQTLSIKESDDIDNSLEFLRKYSNILSINEAYTWDKNTRQNIVDTQKINVNLILNSTDNIYQFIEFLNDVKALIKPSINRLQDFAYQLQNQGITSFVFQNPAQVLDIFTQIENIVNKHNLYLDTLSRYNITKVINNYIMDSMYKTIIDPVNLVEAQTSVDGTTGPLKRVANSNKVQEKEARNRTAGNLINKLQSIIDNQVGKGGIGICAVGLKSFFGLTQYYNYLLNNGTTEEQERVLLGKDHQGIVIGGKVYRTLANIRSIDPSTITNDTVLEALASTTNDNDAALILSALLSLATDNAKELTLAKLNATIKTLGMYIYGISIGMNFKDVANIIMSDVGLTFTQLLDSNVFTNDGGYSQFKQVFDYFEKGPRQQLKKFDKFVDLNGNQITSPLELFSDNFNKLFPKYTELDKGIHNTISKFAQSSIPLRSKLDSIKSLRNKYNDISDYGKELYNQLLDFIEQYLIQFDVINHNKDIYQDLKTLSGGAEEMRILGQIFGLNQGLDSTFEDIINQVNNIERAIYNITENVKDIVDITKFVFDPEYRQNIIDKYEQVKHSFNIFDAVSKVPHFMGYLQTLAVNLQAANKIFKFRSIKSLTLPLVDYLNYRDERKIARGVSNYIGDYMRDQWMLQSDKQIIIPKGNRAFDSKGNSYVLEEDTPIQLGTNWGNATFRLFIENEVIPNLQEGKLNPNKDRIQGIVDNLFIRDLQNDLITRTVSRNPTIVYTLPINMMPRIDSERALLNQYKAEFNKLSMYNYQYDYHVYDQDNNIIARQAIIPLTDLFTYYSMIAHDWKPGEKSLVPILEDFQNSGIIQEFHNFVANLDRSGETLNTTNTSMNDILPYVVPSDSPYSAYSKYIRYRNPMTKKYEIMYKLSREDYEYMDGEEPNNVISGYQFTSNDINTNYFPTGRIQKVTKTFSNSYLDGDNEVNYILKYQVDTGSIFSIQVNGKKIQIQDLKTIPTTKLNGIIKIDVQLLNDIIRNQLNPC